MVEDIAASRIAPSIVCETPSISFSAMLPVKPSVTITSARPETTSPPSTLPTNSKASKPSPAAHHALAQLRVRFQNQLATALRLRAVGQQPDAGHLHAEHRARERGAHERELHEVLPARLGARADVEQCHRVPRNRQRDRERRAVDAARALDVEGAGRERRAGRAGAHERLRPTLGDRPRRLHDRGLRRRAGGAHGILGLRDRDRRVDDLDARRRLAERFGGAEQQHARTLAGRDRRAGRDLSRTEVGAVAVDRDHRAHPTRPARARATAASRTRPLASPPASRGRDRDRGRALPASRSHGRRRCRTPGTPGAAGAGCGTAGTRSRVGVPILCLRTPLGGAAVRLLFLGDGHSAAEGYQSGARQPAASSARRGSDASPRRTSLSRASARAASPSAGRAPTRGGAPGRRSSLRSAAHTGHRPAQSSRQRIFAGTASANASRAQPARSSFSSCT